MRTPKYHLYLTDEKYSLVMQAWVLLKNKLIQDGRYTDAVDELIIKLSKAKRKKVRIANKKRGSHHENNNRSPSRGNVNGFRKSRNKEC